jgi:hypothetical protein
VPLEPPQYICFETLIAFWFASLTNKYTAKPIEGIYFDWTAKLNEVKPWHGFYWAVIPSFILAFRFLGCWLFLIKFGTNLLDGPVQICWVQNGDTWVSPSSNLLSNLVQRQLAPTWLLMGIVSKLVWRPTECNIFPHGHTTTSIQRSKCTHSFATDTLLKWSQCPP